MTSKPFTLCWMTLLPLLAVLPSAAQAPAAAAASAAAKGPQPQERGALSGRRQRMATFYSINPDCASRGPIQLRTVAPPQHGSIAFEETKDFPNYDRDNVRFECDRNEVPAIALSYESEPGYAGPDIFTVEALYPDGATRTNVYAVSVWASAVAPQPAR